MIHKTTAILGAEVHYWVRNETALEPIILVHGFRGNHKALIDVAAALGEDRQIILVDLPGYGQSSPMTVPSTMPHFATFLDRFIRHLAFASFDLWGHSFGGSIALLYASSRPKGLRTLTLVSPTVSDATGIIAQLTKLYYKLAAILPAGPQKMILTSPIIDRISGELLIKNVSRAKKRQLLEAGRRNLKETRPAVIIESSLSYLKTDFFAAAHNIEVPTLVIAGKLDFLVPVKQVERLIDSLNYPSLKMLFEHGHLGPLEVPGTVARLTDEFLRKAHPEVTSANTSENTTDQLR